MNLATIILLVIITLEILINIYRVGKPVRPKTPAEAVHQTVEWLIIAGLIVLATR